MENQNKEPQYYVKGCSPGCLKTVVIIILAVLVLFFIIPKFKATNDDIEVSSSATGLYIIIEAEEDIRNLEIKVTIYDDNRVVIDRFKKNLGDVDKGEKYRIPFDDYTALLTGENFSVEVSGGWKWP